MRKTVILLLMSIVFVSCTNTKSNKNVLKVIDKQEINKEEVVFTWDDFGEVQKIKSKKLFSIYTGNGKIKVLDSLFFFNIMNNEDSSKHLLIITNQKGDTIKSLLFKGKGPNEFSAIDNFDFILDSLMFFYDGKIEAKVSVYKTDDILRVENPEPIMKFNLGKSIIRISTVLSLNKFLSKSYFSQEKFIVVDSIGNTLKKIGEFDFLKNIEVDEAHCLYLNTFYSRNIDAKPNNEKYVVTYRSTDLIEIYDSKGNQLFVSHGPDNIIAEDFKKEYLSGDKMYYIQVDSAITYTYYGIQTSNDYIFVSYKGKCLEEEPLGMHYILVFDWETNPVKAFYIHEPFTSYYIDFKNKFIYTYCLNTETVHKAKLDF
ncbi:MAG: BF3164 family lipoprotein [Bacteroidota bacterium]|nr:BF3164 family lipoprotein [Bacteroidota bacterium]